MMIDSDVSKRIAMLRFLMIFGVVIVHTPPAPEAWEVDGTLFAYIMSFFQNGLFRAGVPVLTMISGFLLFSANADLSYLKLLKKKARTLLVPFLIFNFGHVAAQVALKMTTGQWLGEDLFAQNFHGWMNILFSVWGVPANAPLHFLRELIVLVILSPIIGMLIRKAPVVGLAAICLIFLNNYDSFLINRNDMPVNFYIGGLAAVYHWNHKALDKFGYLAAFIFLAACVCISVFQLKDITWLRLSAPFLIWSAASRLVDTPFGRRLASLSTFSFFIYVTHAAFIRMAWIIYGKAMPSVPLPVFSVVAPLLVVALCIGLYKGLRMVIPKPLDFVLGSRGEKSTSKGAIAPAVEPGMAIRPPANT